MFRVNNEDTEQRQRHCSELDCFCGMGDRRNAFKLIYSLYYCQRFSLSRISDTLRAGFEPAQNLSVGFVE